MVRVAKSSFTEQQCMDNILAVLQAAIQHIPKGWSGIRALHLKTNESVALPVYQTLPEVPLTITAK